MTTDQLPDIKTLWNFSDPAATRQKFRELIATPTVVSTPSYRAELLTQIARTHSLTSEFDEAHAVLDEVRDDDAFEEPVVAVRYSLERGRAFNSAGKPGDARPLFLRAWEVAQRAGLDGLAVDAAHMLGIIEPPDEALQWNQRALDFAEASDDEDAKNWLGALYNNMGWTFSEQGNHEAALELFQKGLKWREARNQPKPTRIAKWAVAHELRMLNRLDEALAAQIGLEAECAAAGDPDGFVVEELGELYLALGKQELARDNFAAAHDLLKNDRYVTDERKARLKRLGGR